MSGTKTRRAELPRLLGVREVAARYGLKDLPAARKHMRAAGGFRAAGRVVVRADDLDAYERELAEAGRRAAQPAGRSAPRTSRSQRARGQPADLEPYWWRGGGDGA